MVKNNPILTIIIPCFNEEKNISIFLNSCINNLKNIDKEIEYIFINDGSKDNTLGEIKKIILKHKNLNINCINFSRNFGKEAALYAGLKESKGKYVAIIDADLQQNPKYILQMYEILEKNSEYDAVACYQQKRKENKFISFCKNCFYKVINKVCNIKLEKNASDFRLLRRNVVDSIIEMQEYFRFSKGLFSFVGFNTFYMPYEVEKRINGKSSWNFKSLTKYAFDGIISFSVFPLKISTFIGFLSFFAAFIYMMIIIIQWFFIDVKVSGYATIVCLILLFGGLQMIFLGILGEYLGRTYIESKNRPIYIVKEKINIKNLEKGDK